MDDLDYELKGCDGGRLLDDEPPMHNHITDCLPIVSSFIAAKALVILWTRAQELRDAGNTALADSLDRITTEVLEEIIKAMDAAEKSF